MNQRLEGHDLVAYLLQSDELNRINEKIACYLKLGKLRLAATIERVGCSPNRNLTRLATRDNGGWAFPSTGREYINYGCYGKSHQTCALGHQACLQGYKTTYLNMNGLIKKVMLSKLDGSCIKLLSHLERQALMIMNDFGLTPITQEIRLTLLQSLYGRYGKKSIIVTLQLPVAKWHEYINDLTLADVILDKCTPY